MNEWGNEPNEMFWEKDGIQCRILRIDGVGFGHLCGYVKVPEKHPWYGMDYDNIPVECHGGLTYGKKEKDGFWIGFDCAHAGDFRPYGRNLESDVYRNMEYVKEQVENIVNQLHEAWEGEENA